MSYLIKRLAQGVFTIYAVVTLGFILVRLMPGGPADYVRSQFIEDRMQGVGGQDVTEEEIAQYLEIYLNINPDKPLWEEYLEYVYTVMIELDLGTSIFVRRGASVSQLIAEAAPWTVLITSIGLFYSFAVGIVLGTMMAYYEGGKFDVAATVTMIVNGAIPYYVVAIVLVFFLSYQWGIFPQGGRMDPYTDPGLNWPFIRGVFYHAALPVASIILTGIGGHALGMRANSIRLIGSDYVNFADNRGISPYGVATRHLARNAVLPMYTQLMISIGFILGGAVILEMIFVYAGMGLLMLQATEARDYPVLMGALTISVVMFVVAMLIADLTYSWIDPRAERAGEA